MDARQKELAEIKSYIEGIDKEVTMILQSLQWNRKHLIEDGPKVKCSYDAGHRVPPDKKEEHERECCVRSQGYSKEDKLFPEPSDPTADTLVKFSKEEIMKIIDNASKNDPMFKKGAGCPWPGPEPLSLERLQATYTADERRALHDAASAVSAAPACHDLADLPLVSSTSGSDSKTSKLKSRVEVLAELRDMRRRRTKYRVSAARARARAASTRNYSHVLRDVIITQMELYSLTHANATTEEAVVQTQNEITKDATHATKPGQHKYDENRDRSKEKERYSDIEYSNKTHRKRYDESTEADQFREHENNRSSHRAGYYEKYERHYSEDGKYYRGHDDRHEKQYRRDDTYNHHDRRNSKDKQKRSQSKERSRRDDNHKTKIVVKEEFDKRDRHRECYESKRDKYSRNHKSDYYYEGGSRSSSSKSKRRHTHNDYGNEDREECRSKDDRKRKRKEDTEKHGEGNYRRYYDNVDMKQEIDSS